MKLKNHFVKFLAMIKPQNKKIILLIEGCVKLYIVTLNNYLGGGRAGGTRFFVPLHYTTLHKKSLNKCLHPCRDLEILIQFDYKTERINS